jgi:class 3 adenylate cyclase
MDLPVVTRLGRRARLSLLLAALTLAGAAAFWAPSLTLAAIAAAGAIALWDRVALDRELRALAAVAAAEGAATKLEVGDGAWGELCHAMNRLQQQRRSERQLDTLQPALPAARAARLADIGVPHEGLLCDVAVLALARPAGGMGRLRETAYAALHQAQLHEALLARDGDQILLIFGALDARGPAAALSAAQAAARGLHAVWAGDARPRLTLTSGQARTVVLPGLGLTVLGAPVEQALELQRHARGTQLLCSEEAYLGLRRIGAVPPQQAPARPPSAEQRPVYAVSL